MSASAGLTEPVGTYRLYKEAKGLKKQGITIKFGGGAGELYKNSFLNQDYPNYKGKPDWKRFLKMKVLVSGVPQTHLTDEIKAEMDQLPDRMFRKLQESRQPNKAWVYLDTGYRIMQGRIVTCIDMQAQWYVPYAPLMERPVVAWAYHQPPHSLELQRFQRDQVTCFCPEIKDVKTDRGLTCNSGKRTQEWLGSYLFLARVAFERIFKKSAPIQADDCMKQVRESDACRDAVKICKEIGILNNTAKIDEMSDLLLDRILAIGQVFQQTVYKEREKIS